MSLKFLPWGFCNILSFLFFSFSLVGVDFFLTSHHFPFFNVVGFRVFQLNIRLLM